MSLSLQDLGKAIIETEYAVRGPIVARAQELEKAGKEIIYCNIGNPQALEQKPLSYIRQMLSLCEYPPLLEKAHTMGDLFPKDVIERAKMVMAESKFGLGAYSESKGMRFVRLAVAEEALRQNAMNHHALYGTQSGQTCFGTSSLGSHTETPFSGNPMRLPALCGLRHE